MRADPAALQELLADMRDEYARVLPERLAHIESLWREIAGGDDSRREELLRAAHSIAGAAATFGLPGVGDAALELERLLQPVCASGAAPGDRDRSRIWDGIAQLLRQPKAVGSPVGQTPDLTPEVGRLRFRAQRGSARVPMRRPGLALLHGSARDAPPGHAGISRTKAAENSTNAEN